MGKKVSQHDKFVRMTTYPVGRLVTQLALPSIASMLITGIYNLVDTQGPPRDGKMMPIAARYDSPLGGMTMACKEGFLTGLWFDGQRHFEGMPEEAFVPSGTDEPEILALTRKWLDAYFSGFDPGFTPPLKPEGTPFRQAVWRILLTIPLGKTMSYGEIATTLANDRGGAKPSARAVGNAVGHNPISLIIPCHRVVGASGHLTGYAAGLYRKASLLALEQGSIK